MNTYPKLKYYLAKLDEITLFAHGDYYDFFRMYDSDKNEWVITKLTFSQLLHDFIVNEVDEKEVITITNHNLPIDQYQKYHNLLNFRK